MNDPEMNGRSSKASETKIPRPQKNIEESFTQFFLIGLERGLLIPMAAAHCMVEGAQ